MTGPFLASAAVRSYPSGWTGNFGVPKARRSRLFRLPLVVALRLRIRSYCWVDETMVVDSGGRTLEGLRGFVNCVRQGVWEETVEGP